MRREDLFFLFLLHVIELRVSCPRVSSSCCTVSSLFVFSLCSPPSVLPLVVFSISSTFPVRNLKNSLPCLFFFLFLFIHSSVPRVRLLPFFVSSCRRKLLLFFWQGSLSSLSRSGRKSSSCIFFWWMLSLSIRGFSRTQHLEVVSLPDLSFPSAAASFLFFLAVLSLPRTLRFFFPVSTHSERLREKKNKRKKEVFRVSRCRRLATSQSVVYIPSVSKFFVGVVSCGVKSLPQSHGLLPFEFHFCGGDSLFLFRKS